MGRKMIVLDDDPTGVQTIHGLSVYTSWDLKALREAFEEPQEMFFILTNSRSFSVEKTICAHREIAANIVQVSKETGMDFVIICRGDSTLRGHYLLEMDVLSEAIQELAGTEIDGQIIGPCFFEGGRVTIDNIHYLADKGELVPVGETEFARDKTFGFQNSHLGKYVEEKTKGKYKAAECVYFDHKELTDHNIGGLAAKLASVSKGSKVIVNAVDYNQLNAFCKVLLIAMNKNKRFIIRSAASFVKAFGKISDQPLLTGEQLIQKDNKNGGIVIVGSHVNKTTRQLEKLKNAELPVDFIEFNIQKAIEGSGLESEVESILAKAQGVLRRGRHAVIFTSREVFSSKELNKEELLQISVGISDALSSIVRKLEITPSFIVAKGGITSSDVAIKGLKVKKALVMGQIKKGIPVWMTGEESKFPFMPYIIFPGNVGEDSDLREIISELNH
ncbi:four-carbon acid sugar kinase family protein, partial [Bacillus sp. B-jedd]|uniref:four-carbon acid sugar kinase family protein n=1 Tax=Bacillus sp. B-jedd TaxID=1476857 RepID=UPI0005157229